MVQKQHFHEQFELFLKAKCINGLETLRGTFAYKLCPEKFLIEAFKNEKDKKIIWDSLKMTIVNQLLVYWSQSFEKNYCKLDKNFSNFFLPKVIILNSSRDIDV